VQLVRERHAVQSPHTALCAGVGSFASADAMFTRNKSNDQVASGGVAQWAPSLKFLVVEPGGAACMPENVLTHSQCTRRVWNMFSMHAASPEGREHALTRSTPPCLLQHAPLSMRHVCACACASARFFSTALRSASRMPVPQTYSEYWQIESKGR
jgi:hypothetical protein